MPNSTNSQPDLESKIGQLEQKLKEFQLFFDYSANWEVLRDKTGKLLYSSPSFEKMTGFSNNEYILGKITLKDIIHPNDYENVAKKFQHALKGESVEIFEFRYITKSKEIKYGTVTSNAIWQNNEYLGFRATLREITDTKKTEIELIEAKERAEENEFFLRKSQDVGNVGSYKMDLKTMNWKSSKTLDRIFGIEGEYDRSVEGWLKIVHPEDVEMMNDYLINEVFGKKILFAKEYRIVRLNDKQIRWVFGNGDLSFDADGNITEMIGTIQDITEQKNYENELKIEKDKAEELKERFDYATTIGKVGTWDWDIITDDLIWSRETYRILGFEPFSIIPSYDLFLKLVHPEDRKNLDNNVKAAWYEKKPYSIDCRIIIDNEVRICNATGKVEFNEDDLPIRMIGTFQNITERKKIEQELLLAKNKAEESELKYRELLNNINDLVCEVNEDGIYTFVSDQYKEILGYKPEELIGRPAAEKIHTDDLALSIKKHEQLRKETGRSVDIWRFKHKNGSYRTVECKGKVYVNDKGQTRTVVVSRDITEQLKNEIELIQAKEKAEESDRLKTAFLQNMSHEIRTPLNAITGFAELLLNQADNREKLEKFTNIIKIRSQDLLDIINDILDISKIESGSLTISNDECTLNELFSELEIIFEEQQIRLNKNDITLFFDLDKKLTDTTIITDKGKLKQVLVNLVNNALKFTESGTIQCICRLEENKIHFSVTDTGIGIPEDKLDHVFERFVQLGQISRKNIGGNGLGLPIVKGLISLLGGNIQVVSKPGMGTTFSFTIDFKTNIPKIVSSPLKSENIELTSQQKTILVVEDDHYNSEYIQEVLSQLNFHIITSNSAQDAIQQIKKEPIDLILMDIQLPDTNGYDAAIKIFEIKPKVKIIAQTAYANYEEKDKALKNGCVDYLSKPVTPENLIKTVLKHLK